jgi:TonB family protein
MSFRYVIFLWVGLLLVRALPAQSPSINEFVYVDQEPKPLNLTELRSQIVYPPTAVEENIQGTVVARILVDTAGQYRQHKIIKSIAPELDAAVAAMLPQLTFTPALQGGRPVMYWINLPFPFRLVNERDEQLKTRIEALTQEISIDEKNYILWHRRAIQRSQLGDYEYALGDFTQSIALNPRKNKKRKGESYEYLFYAYFGRGQVYMQEEEIAKGIADFTRAIEVASEMKVNDSAVQATVPQVYLERSYALALDDQYEAATEDLDYVLRATPARACEVYPLLADIGSAQKNPALSVRAYDGLLTCSPDEYSYYYSRGYYHSQIGNYDAAISDMDSVIAQSKQFPLRLAAHNRVAWCYLQMEKLEEAHEALDRAFTLNAVNHLSHYYLGLLLEAEGKPDQACQSLRKAFYFGLEGPEGQAAIQFLTDKCGGWDEAGG